MQKVLSKSESEKCTCSFKVIVAEDNLLRKIVAVLCERLTEIKINVAQYFISHSFDVLEVHSNLGFRTQFVLEGCSKTNLFES